MPPQPVTKIEQIPPGRPAIYALYGGMPPRVWVAYVGMAKDLKKRLVQHFVNRDSSVVTGASATGLNIDLVRHVEWWEHPLFDDADSLHAAELIAFDLLDPALRSRGNPRTAALERRDNAAFRRRIEALIEGGPTGCFRPPTMWDLYNRVESLEKAVVELAGRVGSLEA